MHGVQGLAVGGIAADADAIRYLVQLRLRNPSVVLGPRDEFFSRLWYVAQRHGLRLGVPRPCDYSA